MRVHHEMRLPIWPCCCVSRDARHCASNMGDEHFAFWRGQGMHSGKDRVDRSIREADEIVTLPVVTRPGSQKGIECRLPADKLVWGDHVGDRATERTQSPCRLLSLRHSARVASGKDQNLLAVPLLGQEWKWRRLPHNRPCRKFVWRLLGETREIPQQRLGVSKRMYDEPQPDLGLERMKPKLERRHHAEIAAPAPQRPEQVRVFLVARSLHSPVGCHYVRGKEVVDGQSKLARSPTKPAAKGQSR